MGSLEGLRATIKEDIKIINKYMQMLYPITEDDRSWLSQNLKDESDKNLEELEIRKNQLEIVLNHIAIEIEK